ncbi:glycoside hydrolase family 2 protein [Actinoplanes sp. TFC3]|uniref:glycoside hydrolase family 2 protein n=1 Tax=Actinoplanes sp. TFC3 TaxID=1710355 RepID=UPI0008325E9B|nr:glycoside hydrolase family 2 protein [Actinoplanes sp. TFC3]
MPSYRELHEGWILTGGDVTDVAATVPGSVHTDLLAAGIIEDPCLGSNEAEVAWIGRTDWVYRTRFEWNGGQERTDLVCDGLDTIATIMLNGVAVGHTSNQHRGYRFDARPALQAGDNDLEIRFQSAYTYAEAQQQRLGDRPNAYPEPFNFIRKQACNFGWDWGPTLVTAGIWQPIGLHTWQTARLAEVRPQVTVVAGRGVVELRVRIERTTPGPLTLTATIAGQTRTLTCTDDEVQVRLDIEDPGLWWPRGFGEQPLYDLDVVLGDGLDSWHRRVGFRTVRVDTADGAFAVQVNEVPVFVKGVNWIPDDVFASRVTPERLRHRFQQAIDANVNYLRVWGGGRYESEEFYGLADELGLLVGQDFLFACAAYPEEEPFTSEIAAEARENVVRLASHPSLVLWTGNNENIWGHADWGWIPELDGKSWGAGFYFDLLPGIVAEEDPSRFYWPGSPWSGSPDRHPNDPAYGTTHIWDVWNTDDYTKYRAYRPRFAAEFGYQAPPTYATLRRALTDDPLTHDSPGMQAHQKAIGGDAKLQRGLDAHLPVPRDFDDWHYLTQLNQARALSLGIEHFRSLRPYCMGAIMWQLNDCWPVTSWAAVDGDGRKKPLWYALRHSFAPRLLTFQPREGGVALVAVNDSGDVWELETAIFGRTVEGVEVSSQSVGVSVAPGSATTVDVSVSGDFLLAEADGQRAFWFFAEDKDIAWPAPQFEAAVEVIGDETHVRVTAATTLRDLTLYADRVDPAAEVDRAGVTLLPGESVTFRIRGAGDLDPAALISKPVLRCVNDVVAGG